MDHFEIIHSLCRIGLGSKNVAFKRQVERLRDALVRAGENRSSASLAKLLTAEEDVTDLKPSRVVLSRAELAGETITKRVSPPVDRETGAFLAQIEFPEPETTAIPILDGGLDTAIRGLLSEWSHMSELASVGVSPARSCLLFGMPGTGKTRLAYAIAARLGLPLVLARLDGLVSSFLGTTARNIGNLFDFANRYRCLLLLDEFDALAKLRDDPQEVGEIKRVVNTVLQNLDQRAALGLTIAITNHHSLLDTAVWRRFEVRIEVPVPDFEAREQIFARYLPPLKFDELTTRFLAWATEGMTGSDIETISRNLKRFTAVHADGEFRLLDAFRSHVLTQAGHLKNHRLELLRGRPQELAKTLNDDGDLRYTQQNLAELFQRDQGTISRWIRAEVNASSGESN